MSDFNIGQRIKKIYPYQIFESYDPIGEPLDCHWAMGCRKVTEGQSQYFNGETFNVADGEGYIDIEILAIVYMPRKIKKRVLYKFDQILPDETIRKSSKIYTVSIDVFKNLIEGQAYRHEYTVVDDD